MNSSCTIAQNNSPLIEPYEVADIFRSGFLYERRSFHVLDQATRTYRTDRAFSNFIEEAQALRQAFREGQTLIVKNLEGFSKKIRTKCAALGADVDVHMYLVPPEGSTSFDYHTDDRDVLIHLAYGIKDFNTQENGVVFQWQLKPGDELWIPKGVLHQALPRGASCLLSFGVLKRIDYDVPGGLDVTDLGTIEANS